MFDKFKQLGELNKMRQQASALQKELEKIIETMEKNGWSVSHEESSKRSCKENDGNGRRTIRTLGRIRKITSYANC